MKLGIVYVCVLGVNVLLLCSVVVAVKGLVLCNACYFFFLLSVILVCCLFTFLLYSSSSFVCLLLLRRLDQVDDLFKKKIRELSGCCSVTRQPPFICDVPFCLVELIRVSVCWFACLPQFLSFPFPLHVSVCLLFQLGSLSFMFYSFFVVNRIPKLVSL